jgi:hypothetical protein
VTIKKKSRFFIHKETRFLIFVANIEIMKPRYFAIAATFILLAFCACSTINLHHVESNAVVPKDGGVYYSLPKTAITVEVTVNKIYKIKGPYSDYANKYLGLSNVIKENATSYSLSDIQLKSSSIPDADQCYFVSIPKRCHKSNGLFLKLSESGIIYSINDFAMNKPAFKTDTSTIESLEDAIENSNQLFYKSNFAATVDTIIEKVNFDTITVEKKVLRKTLNEKTLEQKAKDAADFIIKVKENKFNLLTGYSEVAYSKETIEYMNDQLAKLETEYLNLFTGITVTHQLKYYYTYIPANTESKTYLPLFRFSAKEGIVDTSSYYGESVYMRIDRFGSTKQTASYEKAKINPDAKVHGFYYRIPEYAKVSMILNDKVRSEANLLINQFGAVCELPAGKNLKATFYPNSGSLKSVAIKKRGMFHHGNR